MLIGVPKEIKSHEFRVGMTPPGVRELVRHGHRVVVEHNAGHMIGVDDTHYTAAGAEVVDTGREVFARADLVVKVKEPQTAEIAMLGENRAIFTYLHLAPDPEQTEALMESGCTAIAYETVTDAAGALPLLAPMSEVAGRMAVQAGAAGLEIRRGGRGVLLGGVPGVMPGKVVILGGGVVGTNATFIATANAVHMAGAKAVLVDIEPETLTMSPAAFADAITPRTKAIMPLLKNAQHRILLTGTPALSRPAELFTQLQSICPKDWPNFNAFAKRYCAAKMTHFGLDTSGSSNLRELNLLISGPVLIRRLKKDVLSQLPPKRRSTVQISCPAGALRDLKKQSEQLSKLGSEMEAKGPNAGAARGARRAVCYRLDPS